MTRHDSRHSNSSSDEDVAQWAREAEHVREAEIQAGSILKYLAKRQFSSKLGCNVSDLSAPDHPRAIRSIDRALPYEAGTTTTKRDPPTNATDFEERKAQRRNEMSDAVQCDTTTALEDKKQCTAATDEVEMAALMAVIPKNDESEFSPLSGKAQKPRVHKLAEFADQWLKGFHDKLSSMAERLSALSRKVVDFVDDLQEGQAQEMQNLDDDLSSVSKVLARELPGIRKLVVRERLALSRKGSRKIEDVADARQARQAQQEVQNLADHLSSMKTCLAHFHKASSLEESLDLLRKAVKLPPELCGSSHCGSQCGCQNTSSTGSKGTTPVLATYHSDQEKGALECRKLPHFGDEEQGTPPPSSPSSILFEIAAAAQRAAEEKAAAEAGAAEERIAQEKARVAAVKQAAKAHRAAKIKAVQESKAAAEARAKAEADRIASENKAEEERIAANARKAEDERLAAQYKIAGFEPSPPLSPSTTATPAPGSPSSPSAFLQDDGLDLASLSKSVNGPVLQRDNKHCVMLIVGDAEAEDQTVYVERCAFAGAWDALEIDSWLEAQAVPFDHAETKWKALHASFLGGSPETPPRSPARPPGPATKPSAVAIDDGWQIRTSSRSSYAKLGSPARPPAPATKPFAVDEGWQEVRAWTRASPPKARHQYVRHQYFDLMKFVAPKVLRWAFDKAWMASSLGRGFSWQASDASHINMKELEQWGHKRAVEKVQSGRVESWDVTLLVYLLDKDPNLKQHLSIDNVTRQHIYNVRDLRNQLCHDETPDLDDEVGFELLMRQAMHGLKAIAADAGCLKLLVVELDRINVTT